MSEGPAQTCSTQSPASGILEIQPNTFAGRLWLADLKLQRKAWHKQK